MVVCTAGFRAGAQELQEQETLREHVRIGLQVGPTLTVVDAVEDRLEKAGSVTSSQQSPSEIQSDLVKCQEAARSLAVANKLATNPRLQHVSGVLRVLGDVQES